MPAAHGTPAWMQKVDWMKTHNNIVCFSSNHRRHGSHTKKGSRQKKRKKTFTINLPVGQNNLEGLASSSSSNNRKKSKI